MIGFSVWTKLMHYLMYVLIDPLGGPNQNRDRTRYGILSYICSDKRSSSLFCPRVSSHTPVPLETGRE